MAESGARYGGCCDTDDSIPRGGPIFVPNMVSTLTRVSTFEASVIQELHNLQTCLISDSIETFDDEISVDELKVITEEDLAVKAIEEVFKDDGSLDVSSSVQNNERTARRSKRIKGKSQDNEDQENCGEDVFKDDCSLNGSSVQNNEITARRSKRIKGKSQYNEVRENCGEDLEVVEKGKIINGKSNGGNQESCAGNSEVVVEICGEKVKIAKKRNRVNGKNHIEDQENSVGNAEVSNEKEKINGDNHIIEDCAENLETAKKRKRMKGSNEITARKSKRINRKSQDNEVQEICGVEVFKDDGSLNGSSVQNDEITARRGERINGKSEDNDVRENCGEDMDVVEKGRIINGESNCGNQESCAGNSEVVEICGQKVKFAKKRNRIKGKNHNEDQENSLGNAEVSNEKEGINGPNHYIKERKSRAENLETAERRKIMKGIEPKMEPFLNIKRKQEEQKAAARLHSFNGGLQKTSECENKALDDIERMTSLRSVDGVTKVNLSNYHGDHVPVIYPEVVLCVEVYTNKNQIRTKTQEFLVLGCQFLSELRDKIHCLTDQVMQKAGQDDPSGYFLIEDIFCNDMRDANATDYSEPILDWLRNSKDEVVAKWECILSGQLQKKQKALLGDERSPKLPCFRAVEMQKTRFCDLGFRVGAGYVYCHQGDCKHIIVVRDMRLIHPKDVQNRRVYPIVTFQMKGKLQKCSVCKICVAEKVTVDDKWAAQNPCYFCKNCYYMLHYVNGSLLYEEFSVECDDLDKTKLDEAEKRVEDLHSKFGHHRSRNKVTSSKNSLGDDIKVVKVERRSISPFRIISEDSRQDQPQSRPQLVIPAVNPISPPVIMVGSSTKDSSGSQFQSSKPRMSVHNDTVSKLKGNESHSTPTEQEASKVQAKKGTKRKFEQKELRELVSLTCSRSSANTIHCQTGCLVPSRQKRVEKSCVVSSK